MANVILVIDMTRAFMEKGHALYCGDKARGIIPKIQILLEKEIKVLDLQASSSGKPGSLDGIKQRIDLNEHEEAEFDKKREELRGLIKKMWEEGA